MKNTILRKSTMVLLSGSVLLLAACSSNVQHESVMKSEPMKMEKPFGTAKAIAYSEKLWSQLEKANLVGNNAIETVPYKGMPPHGAILESVSSKVTVDGHEGTVYVKRNYGGAGITRSKVANDRKQYLKAVTVMFKREMGYDSDNKDWYWVKYKANGSLHSNPKGMKLAGRVAKGMNMGCIACHRAASGGDYLFNNTATQLDY
ncbi:MAG: hypothetical protein HON94_03695 [Methylococcales bacterium]|jgi:hypothetical protein|nr:hypothetical protein [Methylococcales bacterium]